MLLSTLLRPALFSFAASLSTLAAAQTLPPPQNVVNLTASATVEVQKDLISVSFNTTREGADPGAVQTQLKQAVDAALAEARKVAKPGQIDVQTGNFSLYPRHSQKGGISGWQGSAELIVEGRDIAGIAQLTSRIQTLTIGRVTFGLSREAREKVEADVTAQAIANFKGKAEWTSKQFGFGGYVLREVSVNLNEPGGSPMPMMRAQAMAASDIALPTEAGKANVTATINGAVQMK